MIRSYRCARQAMHFDAFVIRVSASIAIGMVERVQSFNQAPYKFNVCEMVRVEEKRRRKYGRHEMKRCQARYSRAWKDAGFLWSKFPGMQGEGTACVAVAQEVGSNLLSWIRLWILCCGVWAAAHLVAFSIPYSSPFSSLWSIILVLTLRCRQPYNYSIIFRHGLANSLPDGNTHFDPARSGY